jgi:hypothetical protein
MLATTQSIALVLYSKWTIEDSLLYNNVTMRLQNEPGGAI